MIWENLFVRCVVAIGRTKRIVWSSEQNDVSRYGKMNSDLLAAFVADQRLRRLAPGTIQTSSARIRAYLSYCEKVGLDPLQAGREVFLKYLQYRQERGVRHGTLKGDFSALSSFYELLEEQGKSRSAQEVGAIRKKYLRQYKPDAEERQIISIEQAASMVAGTIDTRDRAILLLLLKTGMRRGEMATLDVADVSLEGLSIRLKPTGKRSNRLVFFDEEAKEALSRWLKARARRAGSEPALFLAPDGQRLGYRGIWSAVVRAAARAGLHDPASEKLEERFGPHCCRHWNATHLLRAGMPREYMQWLRGDARRDAIDIYNHIDPEDVRRAYLVNIPLLGI